MSHLIAYLKSKEFWVLLAILGSGTLLGYFLFFNLVLAFLTRHGDEHVLGNLEGKPYLAVIEALERQGFSGQVIDSLYKPEARPGQILAQDPLPKTRIKKGRKVYLTIASSTAPQVPFPKVEGLPYEQAHRLLSESYGFTIGEVLTVAGEIPDLVVEARYQGEKLMAGSLVPRYSRIDLVITRGQTQDKVPLISVVGLSLQEAMARLAQVGLGIGQIRYKPNPRFPAGTVFQQYPQKAPGDSLARGYPIDLFVSGEPPKSVVE